jgi:hypothetical protein
MRFERDVSLLLDGLPSSDRAVLSGVVSRLLVAHATSHGIDLLDTIDTMKLTRS